MRSPAMQREAVEPLQFVLKVTARCNLDCTYCYVFNKADQSWRSRSRVMSDEVFEASLARIRKHCERSRQNVVRLMFHGGEPTLAGQARFRRWLTRIHEVFDDTFVSLAMQTNSTLIDDEWGTLLHEHGVEVGVSIDGPRELNDRFRIDHAGRGSYDKIMAGIDVLRRHDVRFSILSVVHLGGDGLAVYDHFRSIEPDTINFLFPDHTHEDFAAVTEEHGPHPVADFLLPVADEWYRSESRGGDVPLLRNICRIILGGESRSDMFGNQPLGFVFVEPDGEIEGLDVLRIDEEGAASIGLNVLRDDFTSITSASPFHAQAIFDGVPLPRDCRGCVERETCAGGYLPHRFSRRRGFDNRSVWCADILLLFGRLRELLDVPTAETGLRREVLAEMAAEAR
jgi:uncharacterized protein